MQLIVSVMSLVHTLITCQPANSRPLEEAVTFAKGSAVGWYTLEKIA